MTLTEVDAEVVTKALLVADISFRIMQEDPKCVDWIKGLETACGEIDKALKIMGVEHPS